MGKMMVAGRLVARDLRHRPAQAALLLLAITAATAVLTLGLALHGVTSHPYAQTRAATNGPDAVAQIGRRPPGRTSRHVVPVAPAPARHVDPVRAARSGTDRGEDSLPRSRRHRAQRTVPGRGRGDPRPWPDGAGVRRGSGRSSRRR